MDCERKKNISTAGTHFLGLLTSLISTGFVIFIEVTKGHYDGCFNTWSVLLSSTVLMDNNRISFDFTHQCFWKHVPHSPLIFHKLSVWRLFLSNYVTSQALTVMRIVRCLVKKFFSWRFRHSAYNWYPVWTCTHCMRVGNQLWDRLHYSGSFNRF